MAVNQAQVDHIISTASADDPEVKLLKLQDEVELIKTSIKRLLIDIRERMNDLENPIIVSPGRTGSDQEAYSQMARTLKDTSSAVESAAGALKSSSEAQRDEGNNETPAPAISTLGPENFPATASLPLSQGPQPSRTDIDLLSALRAQLSMASPGEETAGPATEKDKVRLQKVFRLFEWTSKNVKKFGHDRVDLMLDSYFAMGYISEQNLRLVKDMARLMPSDLGEQHEIQADEFVSELYELNHILIPTDSTLDRDMIEVLMEQREGKDGKKASGRVRRPEDVTEEGYIRSNDRM
jgi:hypothetical protein